MTSTSTPRCFLLGSASSETSRQLLANLSSQLVSDPAQATILIVDMPLVDMQSALTTVAEAWHVIISLVPAASLAFIRSCCPAVPANIVRAIALPPLPPLPPTPTGAAAAAAVPSRISSSTHMRSGARLVPPAKSKAAAEDWKALMDTLGEEKLRAAMAAGELKALAGAEPRSDSNSDARPEEPTSDKSGDGTEAVKAKVKSETGVSEQPADDLSALDETTSRVPPKLLAPAPRAALMVSVLDGQRSATAALPPAAAALFRASASAACGVDTSSAAKQAACAQSALDECFWVSESLRPWVLERSSWLAAVSAGGASEAGILISQLDTEEAKPRQARGLCCVEEKTLSIRLPHAAECARLLLDLPDGATPTAEQLSVTRDALLPALRRGLGPVLRDVETRGKTQPPHYWTPKHTSAQTASPEGAVAASATAAVAAEAPAPAEAFAAAEAPAVEAPAAAAEVAAAPSPIASLISFDEAVGAFVADFILPALHALAGHAPPSARLLQLEALQRLDDLQAEAAAAHRRQQSSLAQALDASRTRTPLRTSADEHASGTALLASAWHEQRRLALEGQQRWGAAAAEARLAARAADAARQSFRFPAVGSRVRLECRRPFQEPNLLDGVVERHARNQDACSVRLASGVHKLVPFKDADVRIVEVIALRA